MCLKTTNQAVIKLAKGLLILLVYFNFNFISVLWHIGDIIIFFVIIKVQFPCCLDYYENFTGKFMSWCKFNKIWKKKKLAYYLLLLIKLFITCYNNDNQYYYSYENWKLSYLGNVDFVHHTGIMLFHYTKIYLWVCTSRKT